MEENNPRRRRKVNILEQVLASVETPEAQNEAEEVADNIIQEQKEVNEVAKPKQIIRIKRHNNLWIVSYVDGSEKHHDAKLNINSVLQQS